MKGLRCSAGTAARRVIWNKTNTMSDASAGRDVEDKPATAVTLYHDGYDQRAEQRTRREGQDDGD